MIDTVTRDCFAAFKRPKMEKKMLRSPAVHSQIKEI